MESSNQNITRKTQVQIGGQRQTGHLPNEGLDNLHPGSREMERYHWEGHNFQSLRKFSAWRRRRSSI